MQIFFLPDWLMLILYIVLWPLMQVTISMIGNKADDSKFDPEGFWLKTRKWEKDGAFYRKVLKIDKWKHLLPDGAKTHKQGFRKKHLASYEPEYLKAFIAETGRAEIFHWLQILPFWIFGLFGPFFVVWIMLGYALLVNMPCIIAQRYNRPRLIRLYQHLYSEALKE